MNWNRNERRKLIKKIYTVVKKINAGLSFRNSNKTILFGNVTFKSVTENIKNNFYELFLVYVGILRLLFFSSSPYWIFATSMILKPNFLLIFLKGKQLCIWRLHDDDIFFPHNYILSVASKHFTMHIFFTLAPTLLIIM